METAAQKPSFFQGGNTGLTKTRLIHLYLANVNQKLGFSVIGSNLR